MFFELSVASSLEAARDDSVTLPAKDAAPPTERVEVACNVVNCPVPGVVAPIETKFAALPASAGSSSKISLMVT